MLTSRGSHLVLEQTCAPEGLACWCPPPPMDVFCSCCLSWGAPWWAPPMPPARSRQQAPQTTRRPTCSATCVVVPKLTPDRLQPLGGRAPLLRPAGDARQQPGGREHEVEALPCGLISLMGGKWTTCRPMALDTLKAVAHQCGRSLPVTRSLTLLGSGASADQTRQSLRDQAIQLEALLPHGPHLQRQIMHLQGSHGLQALQLVQRADPDSRGRSAPRFPSASQRSITPSSTSMPKVPQTFWPAAAGWRWWIWQKRNVSRIWWSNAWIRPGWRRSPLHRSATS